MEAFAGIQKCSLMFSRSSSLLVFAHISYLPLKTMDSKKIFGLGTFFRLFFFLATIIHHLTIHLTSIHKSFTQKK